MDSIQKRELRIRHIKRRLALLKSRTFVSENKLKVVFTALCLVAGVAVLLQVFFAKSSWRNAYLVITNHSRVIPDIHIDDARLGHTGQLLHPQSHQLPTSAGVLSAPASKESDDTLVAIGCAITSRGLKSLTHENARYKFPFLRTFLPSFCRTSSPGYRYHFYLSFDQNDTFFRQANTFNVFQQRLDEIRVKLCPPGLVIWLHFIQCHHVGKPAWAQNDAMMEAYLDNAEYFYRVNDDTHLLTPGWTEAFVAGLAQYTPPNIGVVGPRHYGGHSRILTYDFVHRTHVEVFGFYYPRVFTDWWADDWITRVYSPRRNNRLPSVRIIHTLEQGTRYKARMKGLESLEQQVATDRATLLRYVASKRRVQRHPNGTSVISMSLYGNNPRYTFGAIRNAQLAPVVFPGWRLRIYIERQRANGSTTYGHLPKRVLRKLTSLGVELVSVDVADTRIPPLMWRFLVADDVTVTQFIVRDADGRLSERDAAAVDDWLRTDAPFHCVRDHPTHANHPILGGMWGGRPRQLAGIMWAPWKALMKGYKHEYALDMFFLAKTIWRKMQRHAYCHDSVSCEDWPGAHPFPVLRVGPEHVGQVFDAYGRPRLVDIDVIANTPIVKACTVQQRRNDSTSTPVPPSVDLGDVVVDVRRGLTLSPLGHFKENNNERRPTTSRHEDNIELRHNRTSRREYDIELRPTRTSRHEYNIKLRSNRTYSPKYINKLRPNRTYSPKYINKLRPNRTYSHEDIIKLKPNRTSRHEDNSKLRPTETFRQKMRGNVPRIESSSAVVLVRPETKVALVTNSSSLNSGDRLNRDNNNLKSTQASLQMYHALNSDSGKRKRNIPTTDLDSSRSKQSARALNT